MPDKRPVVVLACAVSPAAVARLAPHAEAVRWALPLAALPPDVARRTAVVVLRSGTTIGRDELDSLPHLVAVVRPGSGTDNIDVGALDEAGVAVSRNADVSADAVAELTYAAFVMLARRVPQGVAGIHAGIADKQALTGDDLRRLRVVVWGAGPVGRAVMTRLAPVVESCAFLDHPSVPAGARAVGKEAALAGADAHVLALPLRDATRGAFGAVEIAAATPRPYVLNVGRYELVDLCSALTACADGRLRGFFCDPVDTLHVAAVRDALVRAPAANVLVTPHLGAQRIDVREALDDWAVTETLRALQPCPAVGGAS